MKKVHGKTMAKQKIDEGESNKQSAGRKNQGGIDKRMFIKKYGIESGKFEESRRKKMEKMGKSERNKERYQIEKLKDKLNPMRVMRRKGKKRRKYMVEYVPPGGDH